MTSMTNDPLVSVVIPSYNAEAFIGATLQSVLDQTYTNLEVLVVDDCSKDRTADVAEDMAARDARITVIRLPKNFGAPAGPRNIGVAKARGEWIAFLDADDVWHPEKLRCQIDTLNATGERFCSTRMIDFHDLDALEFTPPAGYATRRITFASQLLSNQTPMSTVVLDAAVAREVPFNEDPSYKAREDMDCWLHCHELLGSSIKIEHPMMGYRISPNQISGRKLQMVKRHYHVLRNYRYRDGRPLGIKAALFTATHFGFALVNRVLRPANRL